MWVVGVCYCVVMVGLVEVDEDLFVVFFFLLVCCDLVGYLLF